MNYIVFDLEWNQSMTREWEDPRMPFEIIEIGAVKLDSKYNIIDEYQSLIKPRLYKKLQPHVKSILNYDEQELRNGRPFDMVCREFLKWCGQDYTFCSWGSMDLHYLQMNMEYYHMKPLISPLKFYNIQQIYANLIDQEHSIVKLEKAVENLNITFDEKRPYHSAVNDAYYTSLVFGKMKPKDVDDLYCFDTYNNPKEKEDEIITFHKKYLEHISHEYSDKREILDDKDFSSIMCYKCGKKANKKIKWFSNTPTSYTCVGKCWYHGYVVGKIKVKQTKNGKLFAIKTMSPSDRKGIEKVKERQNELREKRLIKRHDKIKVKQPL